MTKALIKSLASLALCTLSLSATAGADYCANHSCWFWTLNKSQNETVYFYCDVAANVTHVEFENHNVFISGFVRGNGPLAGTLSLDGADDMAKLRNSYFVVTDDHSHNHFNPRTVEFSANGQIKCEIGKGDRTQSFH